MEQWETERENLLPGFGMNNWVTNGAIYSGRPHTLMCLGIT